MKTRKIAFCIVLFLVVVGIQTTIYGKYIIENNFIVATVTTDEALPEISLYGVRNTNSTYVKYANKTHTLTVRIKVSEKNIKINNLNSENIKVLVGGIEEKDKIQEVTRTAGSTKMSIFDVALKDLSGNGKLELEIPKGAIIDIAGNENEKVTLLPDITIDNIAPSVTFQEIELADGKMQANIIANEPLRTREGWTRSNDFTTLSKEFPSNISYTTEVFDFAQNSTEVNISITKATYILLSYGSLNQNIGWSFNTTSQFTAGKEAIINNPIYKTEIMAFLPKGNIENDFFQVQAYVHTYWGENTKILANTYETFFYHGYNPNQSSYSSMANGEIVKINKENHFILGGDGVNRAGKTDVNGENPIPSDIAENYPFGISGIKIQLKDYTDYSVAYQIFVAGKGWQKVASDGEESTYAHDMPMSAFRIVIVPKTEKESLIKYWNKDIGSNNIK